MKKMPDVGGCQTANASQMTIWLGRVSDWLLDNLLGLAVIPAHAKKKGK